VTESRNPDFTMWQESVILIFLINLRKARATYRITNISNMKQTYLPIILLARTCVQQNCGR